MICRSENKTEIGLRESNVALYTINYLELCAGTGMLGTAVELALEAIGVQAVPVCYIEREAVAAASLVARMEVTGMGFAPIWDDIGTFDCGPWRGLVDCVCGGYPCTPFSCAGKRLGSKDERYLWPRIREIVEEIQPSFCFFENVPGHLNSGFDRVVEDLEGLDYRVAAGLFTSEEVGAPMRNERLYILAGRNMAAACNNNRRPKQGDRTGTGMEGGSSGGLTELASAQSQQNHIRESQSMDEAECQQRCGNAPAGHGGGKLAPPTGKRREKSRSGIQQKLSAESQGGIHHRPELGSGKLVQASSTGLEVGGCQPRDSGEEFPAPQRSGCELATANSLNLQGRPDIGQIQIQVAEQPDPERTGGDISEYWHYPPSRNNYRAWRVVANLDPARMPAIERSLCGVAYGMAARSDQLRLVGNGVDPLAAAYAFLHLLAHFEKG